MAVLLATAGLASPAAAAPTLKKGSLTLTPCGDVKGWWCGSVPRPLDPAKPHGPHIGIDFRWRPPSGGKATGPALVAVEGGPGYPSTGSRIEYTGIYGGALLRQRGLLLVDNRGTGTSDLIDCKAVQDFAGVNTTTAFAKRVEACARQIERRHPGVHAADLYATAYAVNDLAAVIGKLRLGRVDLYGDSYGTFFSQSFMARHADLLHSVVLDSAYPVRDLDPWYVSSATVARSAMDAVCARDAGCAAAAPGSATARLGQLLARLRTGTITGRTRDADASSVRARVGLREVVDIVQDAGSDPVVYRELDASVRAALAGDNAPLLRLVAQSRTWSHGTSDPGYFSNGLYWAVACMDYPQLWTPQSSFARRRQELAASIASGPPGAGFDPFTTSEWLLMSGLLPALPGLPALAAPRAHGAGRCPRRRPRCRRSVPLLIVGGDVDSLTPLSDAQVFGPTLGAKVRVVALANTVHVTSEGDTYPRRGRRLRAADHPRLRARAGEARHDRRELRGPDPADPHARRLPAEARGRGAGDGRGGRGPGRHRAPGGHRRGRSARGRDDPPLLLGRGQGPRPARRELHGQGGHAASLHSEEGAVRDRRDGVRQRDVAVLRRRDRRHAHRHAGRRRAGAREGQLAAALAAGGRDGRQGHAEHSRSLSQRSGFGASARHKSLLISVRGCG